MRNNFFLICLFFMLLVGCGQTETVSIASVSRGDIRVEIEAREKFAAADGYISVYSSSDNKLIRRLVFVSSTDYVEDVEDKVVRVIEQDDDIIICLRWVPKSPLGEVFVSESGVKVMIASDSDCSEDQ